MAAKVDSAAVQDGYQLYHHAFFFSDAGQWCVVQQGMSDQTRTARRYHWLSESVRSFVNEPHEAICSDVRAPTLNLVAAEHEPIRTASVELVTASPDRVMEVVSRCVDDLPLFPSEETAAPPVPTSPRLNMPARHGLQLRDFDPRHLRSVLLSMYEQAPKDFETLPARFAFAHGGKDGTPFPVDRASYDRTIYTLHRAMAHARVDRSDKVDALKRLSTFARATEPPTSATKTD